MKNHAYNRTKLEEDDADLESGDTRRAEVLYSRPSERADEITLTVGELVLILDTRADGSDWYRVQDSSGVQGLAPANYLKMLPLETKGTEVLSSAPPPPPPPKKPAHMSLTHRAAQPRPDPPPQQKAAPAKPKANLGTLRFTLFGHNLGLAAGLLMIVFGFISIVWYASRRSILDSAQFALRKQFSEEQGQIGVDKQLFVQVWSGPFCLVYGIVVFGFERTYGLRRGAEDGVARSLLYFFGSIGAFSSFPTLLPGVIMCLAGVAHLKAWRDREEGDASATGGAFVMSCDTGTHDWDRDVALDREYVERPVTLAERLWRYLVHQREVGELLSLIFLVIFVSVQVILWIEALVRWQGTVADTRATTPCNAPDNDFKCMSGWAPYAKAFGQLLNFNTAILLLPVLHTLLRAVNNVQLSPTASLSSYIPLRKNIILHKFIAGFIVVGASGHIFMHFINFSQRPEAVIATFGVRPWYTGGIITVAMVVILCGAQNRVKRAHYRIFWNSHHMFVVFYFCLFLHGKWQSRLKWLALGVSLYICERVARLWRRHGKPFMVDRVTWVAPVLQLEIFPINKRDFVFKEGQYLYVCAPSLSANERHPFTISSAYGDLESDPGVVTLHIRVSELGWTGRLRDRFGAMAKMAPGSKDPFVLELTHVDGNGRRQRGKHLGPDGLPILQIDGPHAAPAQHYSEYNDVMLVGAGIGLTPSSSILQAVLKHKWKKGYHPEVIRFYWVLRHSEAESFRWFVQLLVRLEHLITSDRAAGSLSPRNRIEMNIYVTRPPKDKHTSIQRTGLQTATRSAFKGESDAGGTTGPEFGFDELMRAILNPTVPAKKQSAVQYAPGDDGIVPTRRAHNRLQDIWVWSGRPDWDDIFSTVRERHGMGASELGSRKVCVAFCGTPFIGKDLKAACRTYSSLAGHCTFELQKENF